jgi:glycerol-3-phosphate acyltransferase PlsX
LRVGIDIMGGDSPPEHLYEAVLNSVDVHDNLFFDVFLTQETLDLHPIFQDPHPNVRFCVCPSYIKPDEFPLDAIRKKSHATILEGINKIKNDSLHAFISCGNTGALVAACTLYLPRLQGIKRPFLLAELPSLTGNFIVLDVGSSVVIKEEQILCQALMGAAYSFKQKNAPVRIGFLNVGTEDIKGTPRHQKVHKYLKNTFSHTSFPFPIEYLGNMEAVDAFQGKLDVLVTDGFTGNIFLKTAESTAELVFAYLEQNRHIASTPLAKTKEKFAFSEYLGAIVAGIEGTVVKCHGRSTRKSLERAIKGTCEILFKEELQKAKELLFSCLNVVQR